MFRAAAKNDPFADQAGLFDLLDRDVIVVFVESYGRTSLDTPLYADLHRETLTNAQTELEALGLAMSSTLLASPTQGGQSWLAHSTFANGLWITDQTSYRAALSSGRQTLFHLAGQSGFHTAAVMPQITLDWPEAQFMGFETILAKADLGYAGQPFNWITMPDQFTFAAMDRLLRDRATMTGRSSSRWRWDHLTPLGCPCPRLSTGTRWAMARSLTPSSPPATRRAWFGRTITACARNIG